MPSGQRELEWPCLGILVVHAYVHIYPNHVPTRRRVFMLGWVLVLLLLGFATRAALA